jgi:hypothetical protein
MEAIFENKVETCDTDPCLIKQDEPLAIPDYLFSEAEQFVLKELTTITQMPADGADDSQNSLR